MHALYKYTYTRGHCGLESDDLTSPRVVTPSRHLLTSTHTHMITHTYNKSDPSGDLALYYTSYKFECDIPHLSVTPS